VPVHVLLGGPTRDRIPAYASTLGDSLVPEDVAARTRELRDQGFRGVKWFPRWGPGDGRAGVRKVVELVEAAREAGGEDFEIMLDAWNSWDIPFTLAVARETEHLRLRWIEEPLLPDDTTGTAALRELIGGRTQIAGGEHEYTRWGIGRLLRQAPLDLYQTDPHWGGGISEMTRVAALVSTAGRQFIPHGQSMQCNAALSFAASPALIPEMEYLLRLAPLYQHFLAESIRPEGGWVQAPKAPGLGMRLDEAAVRDSRRLA
jgi:L-alanine-DL-glutamate epimerase-like enolase superfamily enzyme